MIEEIAAHPSKNSKNEVIRSNFLTSLAVERIPITALSVIIGTPTPNRELVTTGELDDK